MRRSLLVTGIAFVLAAAALLRWRGKSPEQIRATMTLQDVVGAGDTTAFALATQVRAFQWPRDHGEHSQFRTEWWYLTGNLESDEGRRFGVQLTFFRSALADSSPARSSAWAARNAWMAHFAVSDVADRAFHVFEQFARGAAGLAGADTTPFRVWLGPWSIQSSPATIRSTDRSRPESIFPLQLSAAQDSVSVELLLHPGKPLVLHGEAGLSRKGAATGNASYYTSFTRVPSSGTIRIGSRQWSVRGESWMDREWSTSALPEGVDGWDWFALQLSDSSELMFYRFRRHDGTRDRFSAGTFVRADGSTQALSAQDVETEVLGLWTSALDDTRYPGRWRLRVPSLQLDLQIEPLLPDQELNVSLRYWEGAVQARGMRAGRELRGRGFVELTGYSDRAGSSPAGRAVTSRS